MAYLERASHRTMPVTHASQSGMVTGTLGGIAVGALGGAAVGFWFGGLGAIPGAIAGAGLGASGGSIAGEWSDSGKVEATGELDDGVRSVLVGEQEEYAASNDPAILQVGKCHDDYVEEGSLTVFIEKWNFGRKLDRTHCGGQIADGCPTVFVGGDPSRKGLVITDRLTTWQKAVKLLGIGVGMLGPGGIPRALGAAEGVGILTENEGLEKAGGYGGAAYEAGDTAVEQWGDWKSGKGIFKYLKLF